ncbi:hypothetical protein TARUN_1404 [Trichoderma arundinaceum]|uniref:F-box domain-containing protein n=1 Tax=Trichoderma arundinaceum TaxID=490622 RepID=A0A395NXF6_TRIAR|nr:hypothetical protein TARUN_1404 [Trichoderma arundinaceum]
MACLSALPYELSLQIINLLDIGDKFHLSATCKRYRTILVPEIFNTLRFTTDEASATSALIAAKAHGQYMKEIEFTCQCDPDDQPAGPSLPPAACEVLKGDLTPNLHMVRLKFDFDLDNEEDQVHRFFQDVEDAEEVRMEELRDKWRALLNETWEALVANSLVRELILDDLPPKWTSTYHNDAFRRFLGQLESATLNIFGMKDYSEACTNTMRGCREFLIDLDASFFRHMRGLKHLHIRASDPLGLGNDSLPYTPLALKPEDLPLLQSLKLENCFISSELVSFIQSHAQALKSLDINECFSKDMPWAEFFDEIYRAKTSLSELLAGGNKMPWFRDEKFEWMDDDPVLQHTLQKLEADPTLKVFRHAFLDADEGYLCSDEDENVLRFNQGLDQRAYNRLMGQVNENRA